MRAIAISLCCILGVALAPAARAFGEPATAIRLVVNAKNPAAKIEKRFIADAFLKKRTRWDDDTLILPVDLGQKSSVRDKFSHDVLDRDIASVRRYWAQLVFAGRGVPPPELASDAEVVKYVATHAGAIGYVSATADLAGVKTVEVE